MFTAALLRQIAQRVRHFPPLNRLEFIWKLVRPAYRGALRLASGGRGVMVNVGDFPVRLHPDYAGVSFETTERASYAALRELLRPGDAFFDVGAAIGCYTIVASQIIGSSGKIIAFEPDEQARRYLRQHLRWNAIERQVTVREVCCSQRSGQRELYVSPSDVGGQASLIRRPGFSSVTVLSTTLDEEFRSLDVRPACVKIDVEGAEWDVLQGATRLLMEVRPSLLLSVHPQILEPLGITEQQILEFLKGRQYDCRVLERDHEVHVLALAK